MELFKLLITMRETAHTNEKRGLSAVVHYFPLFHYFNSRRPYGFVCVCVNHLHCVIKHFKQPTSISRYKYIKLTSFSWKKKNVQNFSTSK